MRPPRGGLKGVGPEFNLTQDLSIAYRGKCNDPPADYPVRHIDIGHYFVVLRDDTMDHEFPAAMGRVIFIDDRKVCPSADAFTRLRPFQDVLIVQKLTSGPEVIGLHGRPESLDKFFTLFCIVRHVFIILRANLSPALTNSHVRFRAISLFIVRQLCRQTLERCVEAMKTKNLSFLRSRKFLGFLSIAGLIIVGVAGVAGQLSTATLQQQPPILNVPALRQAWSTSCGEAVIAMTYNYAYPDTPITEQEVIDYAASNGYYTPDLPPWTSPANMVKIAKYYADDLSSGRALTSQQGLDLLIRSLRGGDPVIIDVLTIFSDPESDAHFIVVTGVSVDPNRNNTVVIHYNDPLTGTKESADWEGSQGVWNAWKTNDDPGGAGWWLVIRTP